MPFSTDVRFIEAAEARLGVKLPTSFREFLQRSNGGEVQVLELEWEVNPVHDTSDQERNRRTSIDIVHETAQAREWPGFPQDAVAIGSDGCGNHLIFLPSDSDPEALKPDLFIWWHEGPEIERVAADFNEGISDG